MVIGGHGNEFFGPFLTDYIFVQLLLDLVGSGNVINGKDWFACVFLLLFDFGASALSETSSVAEKVS